MRLKNTEVTAIVEVFKSLAGDRKVEVYLFGSRVDNTKKGGDIDLLVIITKADRDFFVQNKFKFSNEIQKLIGEQRIDITFASPNDLETDMFLKSIYPQAVKLGYPQ